MDPVFLSLDEVLEIHEQLAFAERLEAEFRSGELVLIEIFESRCEPQESR